MDGAPEPTPRFYIELKLLKYQKRNASITILNQTHHIVRSISEKNDVENAIEI